MQSSEILIVLLTTMGTKSRLLCSCWAPASPKLTIATPTATRTAPNTSAQPTATEC